MDYTLILDKTDAYIKSIVNSEDFIKMQELKVEIEVKFKELIENFNKAKQDYQDALTYGEYHPDLKKYRNALSHAKAQLFSQELVKEYNELHTQIQTKIDTFINELIRSISNKFKTLDKLL